MRQIMQVKSFKHQTSEWGKVRARQGGLKSEILNLLCFNRTEQSLERSEENIQTGSTGSLWSNKSNAHSLQL